MKVLLIDDERLARKELRELLTGHPSVQICGEAENATAALKLIAEHRPDLLFLDIQMPGKTGFELIEAIAPPLPQVIFTTAYNEYAVRAFEVNALDYLTKPIHPKRLAAALDRARERLSVPADTPEGNDAPAPSGPRSWQQDDRVFVRERDRCWFVAIKSIRMIESEGNHSRIHFDQERPLLHRTLASLEEKLPESLFLRANRSQLVNLSFVKSIAPWFSGSLKAKLSDGTEIEFSRRQAQLFRERQGL